MASPIAPSGCDARLYVTVFIGTYMLMAWADEENWKINRKNPKDFENDV